MAGPRYAAVAEVHFHLGELYFLLPFFATIDFAPGERICLLFTSRPLYRQFRADPLLMRAAKRFDPVIKVVGVRRDAPENGEGRVRAWIREHVRFAVRPAQRARIRALLARTDIFLVQTARGLSEVVLRAGDRRPKHVVRYPHTSSPQTYNLDEARKRSFPIMYQGGAIMLYDPLAEPYYALMGLDRPVTVGYPALGSEWQSMVAAESDGISGHAMIFSLMERADLLPAGKWAEIHRSTYRSIREVFGDIPIVIKPHPQQDVRSLHALAADEGWTGVTVTEENPTIISVGARFGVGFLTGGLYNTMLLDIPSINYYTALPEYLAKHGTMMQDYPSEGVPDVGDEAGLVRELRRVATGELTCDFGSRKRAIPLVTSWARFRELLDA